ncbi:MAG: hypothetical protein KGR26_12170, partial [Cyanobacteria bacterium REEB65]|nr:hypothetical protein [Cyanobacteria bacterium REEB65]
MTEVAERVRTPRRPFTAAEDAYLVSRYATESFGALAEMLDRSYGSVQQRVYHLIGQGRIDPHSRHYQPAWTEDEEERLADLWGKLSDKRIATLLGRTVCACRLKAKRLGINRKMNLWTAREVGRLFGVDA